MNYLTELIKILRYELPINQCLPIEIVNMILFRFYGLQNKNYINCFKEFEMTKYNFAYMTNKQIKVSSKFIQNLNYKESKKLNLLVLKKIFFTRMKNDMDANIFLLNFIHGNKRKFIISRKLDICNKRNSYLITNKNISLISKLLIFPSSNYLTFSESFLEKEISNELGINYNNLCNKKYHRNDLLNIYLSYN